MLHIRHLETDVTTACNLSCVACNHHVVPWRARGPMHVTVGQVYQDLQFLRQFLHADRWGALGGEPLMHKDLIPICDVVRESGIADQIEIWSNTMLLWKQPASFWLSESWDILVASLYPGHVSDRDVKWMTDACQAHGKRLELKDERTRPNFRTILEATPTDGPTTAAKFKGCFFRSFSRNVTNGYFFTCCCAPHMPTLYQEQPFGTDGIRVDSSLTEATLRAYLERTDPLGCCTICAGRETATKIAWKEERGPVAWMQASGQGVV